MKHLDTRWDMIRLTPAQLAIRPIIELAVLTRARERIVGKRFARHAAPESGGAS